MATTVTYSGDKAYVIRLISPAYEIVDYVTNSPYGDRDSPDAHFHIRVEIGNYTRKTEASPWKFGTKISVFYDCPKTLDGYMQWEIGGAGKPKCSGTWNYTAGMHLIWFSGYEPTKTGCQLGDEFSLNITHFPTPRS